jgi:hypothetical protein
MFVKVCVYLLTYLKYGVKKYPVNLMTQEKKEEPLIRITFVK